MEGTGQTRRRKAKGRSDRGWKLSAFHIYPILKHTHSTGQWRAGQGLCFGLCVGFNFRPMTLKQGS